MPAEPSAKAPIRARGKRTRTQLLEAALRVFTRDGYLDARVADIAATAGVAHGSFYTYFDSKADVFREVASGIVEEVNDAVYVPGEGDAAERIRAANRVYFDLYAEHAPVLGLIEQVGTLAEFHEVRRDLRGRAVGRVERFIKRLVADRKIPLQPLDPHVVANALVGMNDDFAYAWFVLKEPFQKERALANIDAVWLRTLGLE